jgi:hypothetical protein
MVPNQGKKPKKRGSRYPNSAQKGIVRSADTISKTNGVVSIATFRKILS